MATADSIVRLKVENSEYDAKIKRAAQGLQHLEDACHKAGGTLAILDDADKKFVQSLGRMETVSKSARGRIGELTTAFTDLSVRYNKLTEEEKKGEYGKALSKSLAEIRQRIIDAKGELNEINGQIQNNGSMLDQLSGKFGVNIKQLGGWGAAIAAGKAALDVMKDAFFASEANLDDWNRTVYTGESAWDAFLTSINTGDISGFLGKIDSIISAARNAYNELDRLSTQKAINNSAIKAQESENERFRAMLRTGRYIAPNDGRSAAMKEGQVLTDAQKKRLAQQLENGMQKLNGFVRSEIDQTTKGIDTLYKQQAIQLGMSLKEFRAGTANMDAFDQKMAGAQQYRDWEEKKRNVLWASRNGQVSREDMKYLRQSNPYQSYAGWATFKDDGDLFSKINDYINQRAALQSQNYSNTANAYRAINRATGGGGGRSGSGGGGRGSVTIKAEEIIPEGSILEAEKKLQELKKKWKEAGDDDKRNWLKWQIEDAERALDKLLGKTKDISPAVELGLAGKGASLGDLQKAMGFGDLNAGLKTFTKEDFEREKWRKEHAPKKVDTLEESKNLVAGISEIGSGLKSLGFDLGKGFDRTMSVVQGIMTITQGVQTVLGVIQAFNSANETAQTVSLATIAANTSIMATNSFSGWLPFANGGVVRAASGFVGGRKYSGDNIPALLNSGEVVLNQAQTSNLATKLNGNAEQRMNARPYLDVETIWLGVNNLLGRMGKGEIVTTRG